MKKASILPGAASAVAAAAAAKTATEKSFDNRRASAVSLELKVGDRVAIPKQNVEGTVRFVGNTQFQSGVWVGVELDDGSGKNDGSVAGVRYFQCPDKCGLFVRPGAVEKKDVPLSEEGSTADSEASPEQAARKEQAAMTIQAVHRGNAVRSKLSDDGFEGNSQADGSPGSEQKRTLLGGRYQEGQRVSFAIRGVVRFVGSPKFAPGQWLGIELDESVGVTMGKVLGVQYFKCPPHRGIFMQAPKARAHQEEPVTNGMPRQGQRRSTVGEDAIMTEEEMRHFSIHDPDGGPVSLEELIGGLNEAKEEIECLEEQLRESKEREDELAEEVRRLKLELKGRGTNADSREADRKAAATVIQASIAAASRNSLARTPVAAPVKEVSLPPPPPPALQAAAAVAATLPFVLLMPPGPLSLQGNPYNLSPSLLLL